MKPTTLINLLIPPIFGKILNRVRRGRTNLSLEQELLETAYRKRNTTVPHGKISIRKDLTLSIHPESLIPFEYFCFRDPEMPNELDAFLKISESCLHLLDVGALHGLFSLAFTKNHPNKSAFAIDASPLAFSKLLYNLHKNPECKVTAKEIAASNGPGQMHMAYEWEHAVARQTAGQNTIEIPCIDCDSLCKTANFIPDIIKIDVEGSELRVLQGLQHTLHTSRPIIFLELHPERLNAIGSTTQDVYNNLKSHDYSIFDINCSPVDSETFSSFVQDVRIIATSKGTHF